MKLLIIFTVLSIINVIFSTVKSIFTIKGGKVSASFLNGGYFAFYNIMLIYTVSDFPLWQKCIITFVCNVVGVWIVKFGEEKARKDKIWRVEATLKRGDMKTERLANALTYANLSFNYIDVNKYIIFNIYCENQKESIKAKQILENYNAKYFVTENIGF